MAGPQYYGTIPGIAQAYQNDPKNKLAQSALALGSSTAPVAQGGWAVTDGLARAAQAVLGAVMQKGQDKKYAQREQDYTQGMAAAAQMANTPQPQNPAFANPAMGAAASALGGGAPAPMQTIDPNTAMGGQGAPQGANMAPPATPLPGGAGMAPTGGAGGPMAGMASITANLPRPGGGAPGGMGALDYYRNGIRPIEGGTDPKTGAFRTSPKGAVGPGQIMPGTGPEAARLAGLPWDEKRFKSDTQYNDALGQAYYAKQLDTFGDPVAAAAAYNAGPGRVRRAMRQAQRSGQDYTAHLPAETQDYVTKFAGRVGGGAVDTTPLPGQANIGIAPPTMEAASPLPEMPTQAPAAPQRPQEVHSNRIDMAQALMKSGNPDLMAIAQTYMDKGLDEQNQARTLASQQEQQQGQTGYTAALNDFNDARSTGRNAVVQDHRDTNNRNFQRETTYTDQRFRAGQAEVGRQYDTTTREDNQAFQAGQSAADRAFQAEQARIQRTWQSSENQATRDNKLSVANARQATQQNRNAYFSTPTGLKMQAEAGKEINANNDGISKFQRFMDLNGKQSTGGFALNTPGIAGIYRMTDSDLTEMNSLANDATLAGLGGSLGTAISDGDRKFIADANISTSNTRTANTNIARAKIGALRRKNDYLTEFANAQADGTAPQFAKEWSMFAQNTPVVTYGKDGNATGANDKPMTFAEWKQSRPRFDANGKRIK